MRYSGLIPALFCGFWLGAAGLNELPEVIGSFRGTPLRRDDLAAPLQTAIAGLSRKDHPEELRLAVRGVAESHLCTVLLDQWLREAELMPSPAVAERCIRERFRELPAAQQEQLRRRCGEPEFQRKCAVELWVALRFPEQDRLPEGAIEDYYRHNPGKFARPARIRFGIIRFTPDARQRADDTRLRLLQGENFDRVAREVDPGGTEELTPEEAVLLKNVIAELPVGAITPVVKTSSGFLIVKFKERVPVSMLPLEEVAPVISAELKSRQCTAILERQLRRELDAHLRIEL